MNKKILIGLCMFILLALPVFSAPNVDVTGVYENLIYENDFSTNISDWIVRSGEFTLSEGVINSGSEPFNTIYNQSNFGVHNFLLETEVNSDGFFAICMGSEPHIDAPDFAIASRGYCFNHRQDTTPDEFSIFQVNSSKQTTTHIKQLDGYGSVWYNASISQLDGNITIYINSNPILSVMDLTYTTNFTTMVIYANLGGKSFNYIKLYNLSESPLPDSIYYVGSTIMPSTPYVNDSLNASVNFSSNVLENFTIEFTWLKNWEQNYTFNVSKTCFNSTICYTDKLVTNLTYGDNWTLSVRAYNQSLNTTYYNKSVTIHQYSPMVSNVSIQPTRPYTNDSLNCSFLVTDQSPDPETITAEVIWFKNGVLNNTFNVTKTINLNTLYYTDKMVTPLTEGDNWTCSVQAFDGLLYSASVNSTFKGIYETLFDNCTILTTKGLYIYLADEEIPTNELNGTIELDLNYSYASGTKTGQAFLIYSGASNYSLCFKPQDEQVNADLYFKYKTDSGYTQRYYLFNYTLSNETKTISLYNFNDTTKSSLRITLRDSTTYNFFTGIVGKLQRSYVSEGVWRDVQMDEADDFGLIHYNIRETDTDYRLVFIDSDNNIYKTTNNLKFVCTSGVCELTYTLNPLDYTTAQTNVSINYYFNNNTNMVYVNWSDSTGLTSSARLLVTKETMTGIATICDTSQSGSSGSMNCNLTGYTGTFLVQVLSSASPETAKLSQWLEIKAQALFSLVSAGEGSFWALSLIIVISLIGSLFGAIGGIMGIIIGLIFLSLLNIVSVINITLIIIVSSMGILISTLIREK